MPSAGCRGHAVFEGADEVVVDDHGLVVAFLAQSHLFDKAFILVDGVVELRVCVGEFFAVDHQLEALGQLGVGAVTFRQGRHLDGVVGDEGGLDVVALAFLAEDFVDEFAFAERGVDFDAEFAADVAERVLVHAGDVIAGEFLDGFGHGDTFVGGFETDDVVADLDLGRAVDVEADFLEHALGEGHHPVIVFV